MNDRQTQSDTVRGRIRGESFKGNYGRLILPLFSTEP